MRTLIFNKSLQYTTGYPVPQINNNEALIRVAYAGICNTDIEITKGYMGFSGVLGHEFAGIVEKCSDEELIGKRVVGEINLSCGECEYCITGMKTHCQKRSVLGIYKKDGVFAEYTTLPAGNLHEIPNNVSYEEAVFVEPLAAALEILEQVNISSDTKVCVLGDGKLGLLISQVLSMTCPNLIVVGKHREKLSILDELGIRTKMFTSFKEKDFDIVVECTGSLSGIKTAMEVVRPRGKIILKTTVAKKGVIDLNSLVVNEITLIGSRCGPFAPAIKAIASRNLDIYPLISREFNIEDGIKAFEYASGKDVLKVILKIS